MGDGVRIWVTRTQPGANTTAARLVSLGYEPVVRPVLEVRAIPDAFQNAPPSQTISCLALTSPNTIDAIRSEIFHHRAIPAYCVGDTTARAASEAGFTEVHSASGDIHALAKLIAQKVSPGLVFAPGAEQPAGDLPKLLPKYRVVRLPVYATTETGIAIPTDVDVAMVHSPRAGSALAKALMSGSRPMKIIAISNAAACPFSGVPGIEMTIADHPDEEAMLRALGKSGLAV